MQAPPTTSDLGMLVEQQQVQFKNLSGETLAGTLHLPQNGTTRGVVLGHCFTCTRHTAVLRRLAEDLAAAGFMALRFDFSGNGQSEGDFAQSTYSKHIGEMQTAADLLVSKGAGWVGAAGHSMGGLLCFLSAAQSSVIRAVCAIGSRISSMKASHFLSSAQREILERTGEVNFTSRGRFLTITEAFFADADGFDLPVLLTSFDKPLLLIHGDQDEIIPVAEAYRARKISDERIGLEVISGADHMFSTAQHREAASRLAVDWMIEQSVNQ